MLAAQLTAARLEVDAAQSEGSRAVEKQKRLGEEVIAQLVSELELVKGAQKEENTSQISHAQAKMALARRRSMKAVHSTSCDWSSEGGSQGIEEFTDETGVIKQLSRERNVMESLFIQENEGPDAQNEGESPVSLGEVVTTLDCTNSATPEVRKRGSLSPSMGSRDVVIMDEIKEHPEDEGLDSGAGDGPVSQEKELVRVEDNHLSISGKEDKKEFDSPFDTKITDTPEDDKEQKEATLDASEELLDVNNACILADVAESTETHEPNAVDSSTIPGDVLETDERRLKRAWFEGGGGMKRADITVNAVAVAEPQKKHFVQKVFQLTSLPRSASVNKRKSYFSWLQCCFGGSGIQVVEPLTP